MEREMMLQRKQYTKTGETAAPQAIWYNGNKMKHRAAPNIVAGQITSTSQAETAGRREEP
jgi:hypothetical protein